MAMRGLMKTPFLIFLSFTLVRALAAAPDDKAIIDPTIPPGMLEIERRLAGFLLPDPDVDGVAVCKDDRTFFFRAWGRAAKTVPVGILDGGNNPPELRWV